MVSLHRRKLGNQGIGLVSSLIAFAIVALVFLLAATAGRMVNHSLALTSRRLTAQALATELVELFRSMNNNLLLAYLKKTPTNAGPYALCTQVNLLDRNTNQISDPDALAALSNTSANSSSLAGLNRFYRVEVLDRVTLAVRSDACGQSPSTFNRGANESFLVTVGVSWQEPDGSAGQTPQQVLLFTMLTDG